LELALSVALVAAVISCIVAFAALVTDRLQWGILKYLKSMFEATSKKWEENGTIGEQLGNWLMFTEKEGEPTNLQVIAQAAGQAMFASANASMKGQMSGDVRHQKGVDGQIFEALENANPQMKAITIFLDKLGLGDLATPEELPYVLNWLQKNQALGGAMQNDGHSSGSSRIGLQ
jgi:hypothetical protein